MLDSDLLLRSNLAVHIIFLNVAKMWTGYSPELTHMRRSTITKTPHAVRSRTEVNMEACEVSIYGFIYKVDVQWKPENSGAGDNEDEDEDKQSLIFKYGFL